jgi:ketosteroid isomerase-like protein
MPSRAAERVRAYYRCVDADDVDGLLELFAPDAVYRRPGYESMRGRDALEAFYRNERVIEKGRHTVVTVTQELPRIAVAGRFSGRLRDGREVSLEFADFFTLDGDGRFSSRETYFYAPLV